MRSVSSGGVSSGSVRRGRGREGCVSKQLVPPPSCSPSASPSAAACGGQKKTCSLGRLEILGKNGLLLEALSGGSWWDAELVRKVGTKYLIHYENFTAGFDEEVPGSTLRLRSRKATMEDCADKLDCGVDVTVFAAHPHTHLMKQCASESSAWYDARIMKVWRRPHLRGCQCKFDVEFYEVRENGAMKATRRLVRGGQTVVVGIGKICILQKPFQGCVEELLEVVEEHKKARGSTSALLTAALAKYFLPTSSKSKSKSKSRSRSRSSSNSLETHCPSFHTPCVELSSSTTTSSSNSCKRRHTHYAGDNSPVAKRLCKPNGRFALVKAPEPEQQQVSGSKAAAGEEEKEVLAGPPKKEARHGMAAEGEEDVGAMWKDFEDVVQDERYMSLARDGTKSGAAGNKCCCDEDLFLDECEGWVCRECGMVGVQIADMVPEIDDYCSDEGGREEGGGQDEEEGEGSQQDDHEEEEEEAAEGEGEVVASSSNDRKLDAIPELAKYLQQHQREGFYFVWNNIEGGGGCILAHAPGTGKSLLVIAFLYSYVKQHPRCRTLIVAPKCMLLPWKREFEKWRVEIRLFLFTRTEGMGRRRRKQQMRETVRKWRRGNASVLLTTYATFSRLVSSDECGEARGGCELRKALLEVADVVILDEGHLARTEKTKVRKSLMKLKTPLRIVLSGTLFQNNFTELFNLLYLARPKSFTRGTEEETEGEEGQARRTFLELVAKQDEGLGDLRNFTKAFVHHHAGQRVLSSLPDLREYAIMLRLSPEQQHLLRSRRHTNSKTLVEQMEESNLCIHPVLLRHCEKEAAAFEQAQVAAGSKTAVVLEMVEACAGRRERVVIFCLHVRPLRLLARMLGKHLGWSEGKEMLQVHGKQTMEERQRHIDALNLAGSSCQLLLASTKACGEGVSLIGASRLIFLDIEWNPAVYRQATSRAFRIGQTRPVFVYRLIADLTSEERRYNTALWKDSLANRIFPAPFSSASHPQSQEAIQDPILHRLLSRNLTTHWVTRVLKHAHARHLLYSASPSTPSHLEEEQDEDEWSSYF